MLKHPVLVGNQVRESGTARLENPARLSPLSKIDGRTAIRDIQERNFIVDEHKISQLFIGYFNNKMTLLIFLIQARSVRPNPELIETIVRFLDDLFRHMLEVRLQKRYRLPLKWLKLFFRKLPDVSIYQRDRARYFIRAIYDAFGLHLKSDV